MSDDGGVAAVDRALTILDALTDEKTTLAELSKRTDLFDSSRDCGVVCDDCSRIARGRKVLARMETEAISEIRARLHEGKARMEDGVLEDRGWSENATSHGSILARLRP